jgi:hypothetical protein
MYCGLYQVVLGRIIWSVTDEMSGSEGIASITDVGGSLLIKEESFKYPVLVAGSSRSDINYDHGLARKLVNRNE